MTDVVLKSGSTDTGAMNRRHLVAIHGGMTSGFEVVHGLLDHVMVRPPAQTRPRSLPSRFLSLACAFSLTLARCVQCTRHTRASQETFFFCFDLDVVVRWLSPYVYVFYVFYMKKYMGSILSTHTVKKHIFLFFTSLEGYSLTPPFQRLKFHFVKKSAIFPLIHP